MISRYTQAGLVKTISLNDFILNTIPTQVVGVSEDDLRLTYMEWLESIKFENLNFEPGLMSEETELRVVRAHTKLRKHMGLLNFRQDFVESLSENLTEAEKPENILCELQDRVVESLLQMGEPSFAVHVGYRTWMLANPNDFTIFRSKCGKYAKLVCFYKYRNKIYKYGK